MKEPTDVTEDAGADAAPGSETAAPPLEMKVYIKPGCPWCISAIAWLQDHGYDFTQVDVIANAAAFEEMRELSGQTLAPTMTYGSAVLADFGVPELEKFIDEHGIEPEE